MTKKKSYFDEDNYMVMEGIMDAQVMFRQFACKYCGAYAESKENIVHFPTCTLKETVDAEQDRT